jgi:hypothetical protein
MLSPVASAAPANKIGKHRRPAWTAADPQEIIVHANYGEMIGTYKVSGKEAAALQDRYAKAKREFDQGAAAEIVAALINPKMVDRLIDELIRVNKPPIIVVPHPEYDPDEPTDPTKKITNALPFALGGYLARELGCDFDNEIIEVARPGRTTLTKFPRFLWQPRFEGSVHHDRAYIIADDVCTFGGTFAALRGHIVSNGGTVLSVTALSKGNGRCVPFPIAPATRDVLLSTYGPEFSTLWKEEIGHDEHSLTEGEGAFLAHWGQSTAAGRDQKSRLQSLRDRLAEAAGKAS